MADPRVPFFELHILPMMRVLDRENMRFKFDLWSYDDVKANAACIIDAVSNGRMPPGSHGGPWPQEWIDLFTRWKATEFHRLELATASGGITAARTGTIITVRAKGKHPTPGHTTWLDMITIDAARREYRLVVEPPSPPQPGPERGFTAQDKFPAPASAILVTVTDAAGTHDVPIPVANAVHVIGPVHAARDQLSAAGVAVPHHLPHGVATMAHLAEHALEITAKELLTEVTGAEEAVAMLAEML